MAGPILVTGGSGTVGSRVVRALLGQGQAVRCLVRQRPVEGVDDIVRGDLGDGSTLEAAVRGADSVLHLAAVTHARRSQDYFETNAAGTERLAAVAARAGIRRFVHASTRAISPSGGAYSLSKHVAEQAVRGASIEHTIIRLPEIYGAGGAEGIDRIVDLARRGAPIPIVGKGTDQLCPMHASDVVAALTGAVRAPSAAWRTYTLGDECMTVRNFVERCVRAFSSASRLVPVPVPLVTALGFAGRVLPVPVYPDQLARLRCEKPPPSPEAERELGFRARTLDERLAELV